MRATPDDIVAMAFFARVVEARSFSDAARSLGVSKSVVSTRVSKLEERLGVRLLHRTTRRLALTADGVRLYERCARVVAEADEAADVAAGASTVPRGTLRVWSSAAFAQAHLAGPLGEFMRTHPHVKVELKLGDGVPDVATEGFDVALVLARRLGDSSLSARKLGTSRVAACAAPSYLRRRGVPFRPQELVHHECLLHWLLQPRDWHFDTDEGPVAMTGGASLVVDDSRFLREATLRGLGITMIPELLVADDLAAGRLHRVLDAFVAIDVSVHALHPHGSLPPASVRAFIDHLVAAFRDPPWKVVARLPVPPPTKSTAKRPPLRITEQDVRRLEAVVALYADEEPAGVARIREALGRARVTHPSRIQRTAVTMSSRVRCRDAKGEEVELSLVYPWDVRSDGISVVSALGSALLGAEVGATVTDDERTLTVLAVPYQPEAAGDHHL